MIETFDGKTPELHPDAWAHASAVLIGDVKVGARSSIWPTVTLRGDMGAIRIGADTSIQDGSIGHITQGLSETHVGDRVTVGHRVILHGCVVEDECLIGMGSIILDNARIGRGSLVGAGSLVTVGTVIPPGSLVMGSPAKVIRPVKDKETAMIQGGWQIYVEYTKKFRAQQQGR